MAGTPCRLSRPEGAGCVVCRPTWAGDRITPAWPLRRNPEALHLTQGVIAITPATGQSLMPLGGGGQAALGNLLQRLPVDAVFGHNRNPTGGHRPQRGHTPALMQQRHLAHDGPRANLGHRPAVDLYPQHPVEQQEQLVAVLALLGQGSGRPRAVGSVAWRR